MQRREFLRMTAGASATAGMSVMGVGPQPKAWGRDPREESRLRGSFAVDANHVRFFTAAVDRRVRVLIAADTHLFADDQRGIPYQKYSGRMAAAYNRTSHFQTGEPTDPNASFQQILARAQEQDVDLLALVGDIFSFPSSAAIEWVGEQLDRSQLRYFYVAGNHDWHYEGMPGTLEELRATWIEKRLRPLYQKHDPLMSVHEVGGIRFLAIDNSYYQILPQQLEFFRQQVASGKPLVLALHIPLYATGRPLGFGCGHPEWGATNDRNYQLERRPRWPAAGHTQTTYDFHREVFQAPNLLGVFAGHIHRSSLDVINGVPQFVTDDNASGAYLDVEFLPAS